MTILRHTRNEDLRDVARALGSVLQSRLVVVERWTARATADARIPINATKRPDAVELVDARLYYDQNARLALTPSFNFVWDAGSKTAQVYEPGGLVANTVYRLTYRVIGG